MAPSELRLGFEGAQTGESGPSVISGDVGLDDSWPASLNTRSNIEEVRFAEDCGDDGPEEDSID